MHSPYIRLRVLLPSLCLGYSAVDQGFIVVQWSGAADNVAIVLYSVAVQQAKFHPIVMEQSIDT